MANPWFRLWGDMVNDPKWRTISRKSGQRIGDVIAVALHMMTCASNADQRGSIKGWCDEDVATALDIDTDQVAAIRNEMQGRILDGEFLTGWEKRQPKRERDEPVSTERVRQFRANKNHETPCNANDNQETPREEKNREEKNRTKSKSKECAQPAVVLPDWIPQSSWSGYLDMRKEKNKAPTARAIELLIGTLEKMKNGGQNIAAVLDRSTVNGWTDVYAIKPDSNLRPASTAPPSGSSQLGVHGQATANAAKKWLEESNAS